MDDGHRLPSVNSPAIGHEITDSFSEVQSSATVLLSTFFLVLASSYVPFCLHPAISSTYYLAATHLIPLPPPTSMFARLTMGAAQLLDVSFQASTSSLPEDEFNSVLQVDLTTLRSLANSLPTEDTWRRVRGICKNSISPVYQSIQTMVSDDVDRITQLLSDLESASEESESLDATKAAGDEVVLISHDNSINKRRSLRSDSKELNCQPVVIHSSHPSAPTIVITTCPTGLPETSCRIPYQNDNFGKMLTVPLHSAFNKEHPPMALIQGRTPMLSKWIWRNGHWEAVLPTLEEQRNKGLYSRLHSGRRKASRAHSTI